MMTRFNLYYVIRYDISIQCLEIVLLYNFAYSKWFNLLRIGVGVGGKFHRPHQYVSMPLTG